MLKTLAILSLNSMNIWIVEQNIRYQERMIFRNATKFPLSFVLGAGKNQNLGVMGEEYSGGDHEKKKKLCVYDMGL